MSAGPQNDDGEALSEVNVIPLADLSLVLLIILMVISPMVMQSMIKVNSSRATATKSNEQEKEPPLILVINADGTLDLNKERVSDIDLVTKIVVAFSNRIDKSILVTVDPLTQHGRFVSVLDVLKQNGAQKISLLKKAGSSSTLSSVVTGGKK